MTSFISDSEMALRSRLPDIMLQREIENGKLLVERASAGDASGVQELLDQNVRPNADEYIQSLYYKSKNYLTPLHMAASKGHLKIVKLLIEADGNAPTVVSALFLGIMRKYRV